MPLPDISELTLEELTELIRIASLRYEQTKADRAEDIEARKVSIEQAIVDLQTLLGPVGSGPGTETIRGILQFTDAQMVENAGLAFRRIFQGLEILTDTTLDVAMVVRNR